jgi:hypothetical protein
LRVHPRFGQGRGGGIGRLGPKRGGQRQGILAANLPHFVNDARGCGHWQEGKAQPYALADRIGRATGAAAGEIFLGDDFLILDAIGILQRRIERFEHVHHRAQADIGLDEMLVASVFGEAALGKGLAEGLHRREGRHAQRADGGDAGAELLPLQGERHEKSPDEKVPDKI